MLADRVRMTLQKVRKLIDRTTTTVVINQPYSTEGNGGRKLVRLDNGWLVLAIHDGVAGQIKFYCSKDNGDTFFFLRASNQVNTAYFSIACKNFNIYAIFSSSTGGSLGSYRFNINDPIGSFQYIKNLESSATAYNAVSLAINKEGTELHACWSSKNSTYPNSFNIRYCKGIISGDGSVTWGNVEQVSTLNTNGFNRLNLSIVLLLSGTPCILTQSEDSAQKYIINYYYTGTTWSQSVVYGGGSHIQLNPSSCADKYGVIHLVWTRYDGTYYRVSYSKSTNFGITWSAPKNILIGDVNSKPSITSNSNGDIFIECRAGTRVYSYKSTDKGETWSSTYSMIHLDSPSLLDDNTIEFEEPLNICMTTSSHATFPNSVIFMGKWYEK